MCLYPKLLSNPKYKPNKKNGGHPPKCNDKRVLFVPVGCGKCMECMKQKAGQWRARLGEEILDWKGEQRHFITLTFNTESLRKLRDEVEGEPKGYELDNAIATLAVRKFLERWRQRHGTSPKHWFITELGHEGTEHIHIHGLLFTQVTQARRSSATGRLYDEDITAKEIREVWGYGYTFKGSYVNEATINYIVKYCLKADDKHKTYKPTILCSPGIGKRYKDSFNAKLNKFNKKGETKETYNTRSGSKINLPMYWRNHLYTDEEREELWKQKLDKNERWVDGQQIAIKDNDYREYNQLLKIAQKKSQRLGYGTDKKNWDQHNYEQQRRNLIHSERLGERNRDTATPTIQEMERQGDRDIDRKLDASRQWLTEILNRPTVTKKYNNFEE